MKLPQKAHSRSLVAFPFLAALQNDVDAVVNWQRNGRTSQDDPTGEFTRIDQMLPKTKGQSLRIVPVISRVHSIGCATVVLSPATKLRKTL